MLIQLKSDTGTTKNGVRPLLILETNKTLQQENWRMRYTNHHLLEVFLPLKAQIMSAIDFNDAATSKSTLIRRHFLIVKAISTHAIGIYSQR